ncbi:SET and MYND domain-containing protein 4-like [Chironomus tepperi]|uniref:SET and MYND domain-containing protein 4-like n=1 Tax=Chironomus tepperi TaxID=113505 RepID=UPI00391F5B05
MKNMDDELRKSNKVSESCRSEGNRFYVQRIFFDAILKYNESLCYAVNGSENVGLAYANRSAVYFEMKLYDKSLRNIELARANNYPEKNYEILKKRESKCKELMKNSLTTVNDLSFFKLSYEGNKDYPSIAACLEKRINNKYGRHIITNKALNVGDIIAIEDPVYKVIKSDERYSTCYANNVYQRCENCLDENLLDLIPCTFCTKAMYCSSECMNYSFTHYHKYECSIVEDLLRSGIKHVILRIFFEGLSAFNHDINKFKEFVKENEGTNFSFFEVKNSKNSRELFLATLSLASKEVKVDTALEFEELFKKSETLNSLWINHQNFITNLLQKLSIVGNRDIHGIGAWSLKQNGMDEHNEPKNPSQYQQLIGNACYLFSSLLNHSCAPNIKRLNVGCKNVIVVCRPISAGDQLFDSYRQNFNLLPKSMRQESLMKDYGFICDCEACINEWPLNKDLDVINDSVLEYAWESHDELPYLQSKAIAVKRYKEYCDKFMKHGKNFPSAELVILQECISNCLLSITKPSFQF